MPRQHPQNMRKHSAMIDNPDGAISHKDKSSDVLKEHEEQGAEQVKGQVHSSISPFVEANADTHGPKPSSSIGQSAYAQSSYGSTDELRSCSADSFRYSLDLHVTTGPDLSNLHGHTSGSGDDKRDDSAYLASGSAVDGYDGSASSAHDSSSGAGTAHDGSTDADCRYDTGGTDETVVMDSGCKGLSWSVGGESGDPASSLGSGSAANEERANYGAINVRAGRMSKEQARGCRETFGLDGIVVELQRMRDKRSRELKALMQEAELQRMRDERSREVQQLTRMLEVVNQETDELQSPSLAETRGVWHASLARPGRTAMAWLTDPAGADEVCQAKEKCPNGRDQAQAGPVTLHRELSARANASRMERAWQSSAQAPTGQGSEAVPRPLPSSAASTAPEAGAALPVQVLEGIGSKGRHTDQALPSLPRRKRTLRPLPSWARTVIVRNVPWSYSQEDLLAMWPPSLAYDYFHTPYHFYNDRPLGHAYLNFVTYEAAAAFQYRWHGRFLTPQDTKNTLDITAAFVQGRGPNLARITQDKIPILLEKRFLPVLLDGKRRLGTDEVIAEWNRSCPVRESEAVFGAFQ